MSYTSKYTGEEIDNGITPVGTVIAFMGTKAPKGYLICDGTEYNITDYPKLANHFTEQFENIAYFGGDGINTFKVPDLRNEFLRGYHGDKDNPLSGEIGIHQDATQHANIYISNYGKSLYSPNYDYSNVGNTNKFDAADTQMKLKDMGSDSSEYNIATVNNLASNTNISYAESVSKYTSRPTNVAVLYCIKY